MCTSGHSWDWVRMHIWQQKAAFITENNRVEPLCSQQTVLPILARVRHGCSPWGKEGHAPLQECPGGSQGSWAGLSTTPHSVTSSCPSLYHIPCYRRWPSSQSSIKCYGNLASGPPCPPDSHPPHWQGPLTRMTVFKGLQWSSPPLCPVWEKRHSCASGRGGSVPPGAGVRGAPERHQSNGHLRTAPVYFRGKALTLYQKRALLPTRSRDDRYSWWYFFRKGGFSPIAVGSHVFLILTKDHPTSGMAVYISPQAAKPS